jgi:hypothetical protein
VSKRHQSSRRKSYGRRQHELRERHDRDHHVSSAESELDEWASGAPADPFAFMDPRAPRLRLVMGD